MSTLRRSEILVDMSLKIKNFEIDKRTCTSPSPKPWLAKLVRFVLEGIGEKEKCWELDCFGSVLDLGSQPLPFLNSSGEIYWPTDMLFPLMQVLFWPWNFSVLFPFKKVFRSWFLIFWVLFFFSHWYRWSGILTPWKLESRISSRFETGIRFHLLRYFSSCVLLMELERKDGAIVLHVQCLYIMYHFYMGQLIRTIGERYSILVM